MPFEASTMDRVERFFFALMIIGLAGLFAVTTWAGLLWLGAVAVN
jgi:hypothetical protein